MEKAERLFDLPRYQLARYPRPDAIATKEDGQWRPYSTQELVDLSERIAYGLMALGVGPGDKVAIASGNRSEWVLVDQAILQIGAVTVPVYPTSSPEDYAYILQHGEVEVCFSANADIHAKALEASRTATRLKHLFTFDRTTGARHWSEVPRDGSTGERERLQQYRDQVQRTDLATIIYTSGTTGRPKGVLLSHWNVLSNAIDSTSRFPVDSNARAISFLPLSHIYERMLMYLYIYNGVSVHFQESLDDLGDRIREVAPDVFTAVPRLLEKIYDKILGRGEELKGVKRKLFFWALDLGLRYDVHGKGIWYRLQLAIARKLVFSKWRAALGGNVRVVASGSAALQPRLARVFNAAGIPVMEGYGLTEASPVISVNDQRNDGLRFTTVGRPIPNVEVRIAEDGEILVKGPNIMQGYFKEPEMTAQALDAEGWLHTGDIGELTREGFLRITDRKKEMFKTSGGKYVAPQVLENKLKASRFIEQVMVIGENRKFPAALIVPNFEFLQNWCALKGIPYAGREAAITDKRVSDRIMREVEEQCAGFGHWEQVKKIALLSGDWTIEGGELTPSLKLRRKPILSKYAGTVEGIYA
ncbi:MAG: long-chain fatty acid--CoA ligase [Flavobacteriales bacterium]|nr:long-chain fatty acid--CoA ligase [Flavobacteriales bacterium]MCB9194334.1 long-chain fatty acid--CoA ligase [Flavobacteriales bacterium]